MQKNQREKAWKATAKVEFQKRKNTFDDADIANLNNDDSFYPIDEEEQKQPLTEEEKTEVRKKLFILLIIIIIVIIGFIYVLIFNPFKEEKTPEENTQQEETDESEEEENNETTSDDSTITLDSEIVKTLEEETIYQNYEYYNNDTLALYRNNSTNITDLDNKTKLFLASKTNEFKQEIENNINTTSICNSNITINTSVIDEILKNRFNTSVTAYEEFIFSYYKDKVFIQDFKFTKKDNSYIGECYQSTNTIDSIAQQQITSVSKENDTLYINYKVVFIKETGVYKDPNFTTLITNDKSATTTDYINEGNTYQYVYTINNGNYTLTNVALLK